MPSDPKTSSARLSRLRAVDEPRQRKRRFDGKAQLPAVLALARGDQRFNALERFLGNVRRTVARSVQR
jgi:hypothetical protein